MDSRSKDRDTTKQIQADASLLRKELETQLKSLEQENLDLRGQLQEARELVKTALTTSEADATALRSELDELRNAMSTQSTSEASLLRDELKQLKQDLSKQSTLDVLSLRRDLKQLQDDLSREQGDTSTSDNISLLFHELDILSRNVARTNNRANQIESLQMDVELFRTRLQRMEGIARPRKSVDSVKLIGDSGKGDELSQPSSGPVQQKRPLPDTDNSEFLGATPPKKRMMASDGSSGASRSTNSVNGSSPTVLIGTRRPLRRINFGAITGKVAKQGV
jgi:hypothetical protein